MLRVITGRLKVSIKAQPSAAVSAENGLAPIPPLLPVKREWRDTVLGALGTTEDSYSPAHRSAPRRDAAALTKSTRAGTSPGTSGAAAS